MRVNGMVLNDMRQTGSVFFGRGKRSHDLRDCCWSAELGQLGRACGFETGVLELE